MPRPNRVHKHRQTLLLTFLILVAVGVRVAWATRPGLWVDEVFSLAMATGHSLEHPAADADPGRGDYVELAGAPPPEVWRSYARHGSPAASPVRITRAVMMSDTSPPLYYLLLGTWTRVVGTSDAALRLFSALLAAACFPLLWLIGREMGGRQVGWIACVLFAFSPPAIYYAGEGRMYALLWLLGLSLGWLSVLLRRRGPRATLLLLWIVIAAAGLLTHYFFAFVWLACTAWLGVYPRKLPRALLFAAVALTVVAVLPWYLQLPDSLARWRVTAGWLDYPLSPQQVFIAPLLLAWSLLSGHGVWGGSEWADVVAAALYALLIVVVVRRGIRPLFTPRRWLLWLWVAGAAVGPVVFDLLRGTNASLVARYALAGLPAAMLLAAVGISRLPRPARFPFVLLILLTWGSGIRDMFAHPARPWEPFPQVANRIERWAGPADLVVVHSIPSGVVGIARYLDAPTPLLSWVPQLGQRTVSRDLRPLLDDKCRVALVKIHDMGEPSPAEAWLRENAVLERTDSLPPFTEIQYFRWHPRAGTLATRCPA